MRFCSAVSETAGPDGDLFKPATPCSANGAFNRSRQHLSQPIGWTVKGQRFSRSAV